ncbi:MAG: tRNA uridine(34) 5-carboxymethylaminomethyl modification radical SAM/GNAT enzyme Elp3 [Candidatus Pacebacteria bacterium]|nr:tRNA uridine(34) 5-carboxymethylaminomethyl modification radical SAM/GNAT enzyme Elp3 [Candidatus Paceibacterota bacterium]
MEIINQKIGKELFQFRIDNRKGLDCFKRKIAKKYKIAILKNSELLKIYHEMLAKKRAKTVKGWTLPILEKVLIKRPVRSLSGIVNVSVLTKPYPCPGKCIFCPSEKGIPKSYLSGEPAVQRAIRNKFNPYKQVKMRLTSLQATGHPIDKVELRTIGGTWSFYPKKYQEWFISECFRACNEFANEKLKLIQYRTIVLSCIKSGKWQSEIKNLNKLQRQNEKAKCRIVGIAVETRPDFINLKEIQWMRELGITKVELGIQSIYDDALQKNQRGHNVAATITATGLLKNAGFKVSYQMMPGLFGSNPKKDLAMFKEIFENPDFKPDYLKIYPLALVKNTKLYQLYKQGKFKPYTKKQLVKLIIEIKKIIPGWCRVERIIRDIPPKDIVEGGSNILNMREVISKEMVQQGLACQCIRCREVKGNYDIKEKIYLFREDYEASSEQTHLNFSKEKNAAGREIFLSFENKARTKLYGLLRLRFPNPKEPSSFLAKKELGSLLLPSTVIIRELHIYGQMAQIRGDRVSASSVQHRGLGKKLLAEAEKIAKKSGVKKIAVISGIGVRPYYRKLGYKLQNTYMVKNL